MDGGSASVVRSRHDGCRRPGTSRNSAFSKVWRQVEPMPALWRRRSGMRAGRPWRAVDWPETRNPGRSRGRGFRDNGELSATSSFRMSVYWILFLRFICNTPAACAASSVLHRSVESATYLYIRKEPVLLMALRKVAHHSQRLRSLAENVEIRLIGKNLIPLLSRDLADHT